MIALQRAVKNTADRSVKSRSGLAHGISNLAKWNPAETYGIDMISYHYAACQEFCRRWNKRQNWRIELVIR
jgi:hypothetical protein